MIPDYQTIMLPLLELVADGKTYTSREAIEGLAERYNLTEEERKELLPSGQQPVFDNRVGWARTYLKKAGLVKSEKRGTMSITEKGKQVLSQKPSRIDISFLEQFPEFVEFRTGKNKVKAVDQQEADIEAEEQTPEELLEYAHQKLQQDLAAELLLTIKEASPRFFENLVVDLLLQMGYGGSRADAGRAIGKTSDGGIDGIIKEDKLGLDIIYIQAKRWENSVPIKEIRDFAGALLGNKARKGVFITTSSFPASAHEYVRSIEPKIILIDGQQLARLMIEHNVGVSPQKTFQVKRIDSDYFEE